MKSALSSTIALTIALVSLATIQSTELAAGDRSNRGASVSADRSGASVSAGGVSVSADRGGASVSSDRGSVSADRGGASVSSGGASASADRGGASASSGGASVSAGGASAGAASASADRADAGRDSENDRRAAGMRSVGVSRPVGDRSYDSFGEWFDDLRSSWSGGRSKGSDVVTTTRSSATKSTETSESGRAQVNRVTQKKSSTAIATDGGAASAEASNINVTEQKN